MDNVLDVTKKLFSNEPVGTVEAPINPQVEIFGKVVDEIYSFENLEAKTDINDSQIMAFSQARAFAKTYDLPLLAEFVSNLSKYSISRGRKGRNEFKEIAKANLNMAQSDEIEHKSIPARLLGR